MAPFPPWHDPALSHPCARCVCPAALCRDVTKTQDFDEDEVEDLKVQVLAAVASLDRGLAANVSGTACQQNGSNLAIALWPTSSWDTSKYIQPA